jgi:hypothetical protein
MPHEERKRCFECGVSYPPDTRRCEEDHLPLWPDTVNGVWRIEGILSSRPGGATCAAYHLGTGARVAIDLVRGNPSPDPAALKALTQELQALRLLEHPNCLRLIEEGVDRTRSEPENGDGIHFVVTDLGSARPLPDLLEDWQRAGGPAEGSSRLSTPAMSQIGRQILGLLSAAHRLGLGHGRLSASHIYVTVEEDSLGALHKSGSIRLHGLRAIGLGPVLREAIDADLTAVMALLFELTTGNPPPRLEPGSAPPKLPSDVDGKLAQFILRGLGVGRATRFGSADEMLRALVVASPAAPAEISAEAIANLTRTDPQAARPASSPEIPSRPAAGDSLPGGPPALPRLSGQHGVLPAPPAPVGGSVGSDSAVRSRFSGELKQVSFRDLVDQKDVKPGRDETLARRRRVSSSSMKISALPIPPPSDEAPLPRKSSSQYAGMSSGDHAALEPTADLQALPVDFASAISGPVALTSSMREGRSEISLPPQPSLPPEVARPSRPPPQVRPAEPTKSNPPRPAPAQAKSNPPRPAPAQAATRSNPPRPVAPAAMTPKPSVTPAPPAELVLSDDSIDPLGITGQGPIPMDVLKASVKFQQQLATVRSSRENLKKAELVQLTAPTSEPAPSAASLGPVRLTSKPIWPWLLLLALLLLGGVALLVLR